MIDLTEIIRAVIALLLALITSYLIPLIRRKADAQKLATLRLWVNIAVTAAEQIFKGTGLGEEKKAYVIEFLQAHGFTVDMEELDNLIESAVHELKS